MFSGIIETVSSILQYKNEQQFCQLTIARPLLFDDLAIGHSVSVNGVCLTITKLDHTSFCVDVMAETLNLTTLGKCNQYKIVNLERALSLHSRIGGHLVQGHIDGIAIITEINKGNHTWLISLKIPPLLKKYIVKKGYITIDGISLTIVAENEDTCQVSLIPHTFFSTIVQHYHLGQAVNIEVDIIGKYLEKYMEQRHAN